MLQNLSVPKKLILSFLAVIAACGTATLIVLWCVATLQRADAADLAPKVQRLLKLDEPDRVREAVEKL